MKFLSVLSFLTSITILNMQAQTKDPLNTKEYTLENGLKVFISVNKVEPKIQTLIAVKAGSKFDPSETTGLAHYLEHLMFKGTPTLGTNNWETEKVILNKISDLYEKHKAEKDVNKKKEIYKEIDKLSYEASKFAIPNEYDKIVTSLGAQGTNAYTSTDQTVYINSIPNNEFEKWARLESERFNHLVMRLFHTELETVYEEYNISQDNDGRWAYANLLKGLFSNHPYGTQTTIGEGEHLKNPSMVNIRNYFEKYYVPNNVAICLSGDIDPDKALEVIKKYFGTWKSKSIEPFVSKSLPAINAPIVLENFGKQEEFVYIGFRIPAANNKESLKARLIDQIMANGTAGLIDINLVQKQKMLEAYSFPILMHDHGVYSLYGKPKQGQTLEEVKTLLLEQLEEFKKGNFEDWMLDAAINDVELKKMKEFESNRGRASAFVDAFTNSIEWKDYVAQIEDMRKFTKKDIIDFANTYFKDNNYVISYKRKGEQKNHKVDKPEITPVVMNRDQKSQFFDAVTQMPSDNIDPLFVDFNKEIQTEKINDRVSFFSIKNNENQLSKFSIIVKAGSDFSPKMAIISKYIKYLGTNKLSAENLQKELFKNGLEINNVLTRDQFVFTVSGLDKNMPKGISYLFDLLNDCKVDALAFDNLKKDILKERENSKMNKGAIFGAAVSYAKYGPVNPTNSNLSNEAISALKAEEIIQEIKNLKQFGFDLFTYSDNPLNIRKAIPANELTLKWKDNKNNAVFKVTPKNENKILLYNYKGMAQSQIMLVSDGVPFNLDVLPFAYSYSDYYGSGLSSIVFQELREQKALAYSAYSAYQRPSNLNETFSLVAFIGSQSDKMPTAMKEFKKLLDKMSNVPIQFQNSKESTLKQIASDRIVRDNIFWQYYSNKKLGIDYDYRKNIFEAVKTRTIEQFEQEFSKLVSNKKFTTVLMGDKSMMNLDQIKEFGEIEEINTQQIFGY